MRRGEQAASNISPKHGEKLQKVWQPTRISLHQQCQGLYAWMSAQVVSMLFTQIIGVQHNGMVVQVCLVQVCAW